MAMLELLQYVMYEVMSCVKHQCALPRSHGHSCASGSTWRTVLLGLTRVMMHQMHPMPALYAVCGCGEPGALDSRKCSLI
eukprot:3295406-Amphidinium_carterae.1